MIIHTLTARSDLICANNANEIKNIKNISIFTYFYNDNRYGHDSVPLYEKYDCINICNDNKKITNVDSINKIYYYLLKNISSISDYILIIDGSDVIIEYDNDLYKIINNGCDVYVPTYNDVDACYQICNKNINGGFIFGKKEAIIELYKTAVDSITNIDINNVIDKSSLSIRDEIYISNAIYKLMNKYNIKFDNDFCYVIDPTETKKFLNNGYKNIILPINHRIHKLLDHVDKFYERYYSGNGFASIHTIKSKDDIEYTANTMVKQYT